MKQLFGILLFSLYLSAYGQVTLPELSPEATLSQHAGYTAINLRYGRPAARGRKIFPMVVPFGQLWRTGANKCTMLSIDRPVTIGGKEIAAGAYALLTIPGADFWTVLLNTDTSRIYGRADEYEVKNEVLRFNVTPEKAGRFYESLTLDLDIRQYNAELYIAWENTQIHFSILTHADSLAMSLLNDALQKNPDDTDLLGQATEYYLMNDKDPAAQLQMLNHALQVKKDRWLYRLKTDVCIRQKNYSEARKTAREAIAFLQETKPSEWERSVHTYEQQRKQWP